MNVPLSRRALLRAAAATAVTAAIPGALAACVGRREETLVAAEPQTTPTSDLSDASRARLGAWIAVLRAERLLGPTTPLGRSAVRVGELAVGTPYEAFTLEAYLRAGGSPIRTEPLTATLTRFDCVSLVEACFAVARAAEPRGSGTDVPAAERFTAELERMRYRGGDRRGYTSRLHYFSEWITDGERRGLLRDQGQALGGVADSRPLRFMTEHRASYPALANDAVFAEIGAIERTLDQRPRWVVPTASIPDISERLQTGDVLGFATSIAGLDVTHAAFAYRDPRNVLRVLHAPLSGGAVEVTGSTLPEYVAAIGRATGILVARPLWGLTPATRPTEQRG